MECTCLTPFNVLETSGHVEKFTDLMVSSLGEVRDDASKPTIKQRSNLHHHKYRVLLAITFNVLYFIVPNFLVSTQVKDLVTGEPFRADKLLEDFIDNFLEKSPTMPSEERESHLKVQRQADTYTPHQLV